MYSKIIEAYPKCTSCHPPIKENFGGAFSIYGALKFPQRNCFSSCQSEWCTA